MPKKTGRNSFVAMKIMPSYFRFWQMGLLTVPLFNAMNCMLHMKLTFAVLLFTSMLIALPHVYKMKLTLGVFCMWQIMYKRAAKSDHSFCWYRCSCAASGFFQHDCPSWAVACIWYWAKIPSYSWIRCLTNLRIFVGCCRTMIIVQ